MTSDDESPILLNGQVPEEQVRVQHGDTVVLVNPAMGGRLSSAPWASSAPTATRLPSSPLNLRARYRGGAPEEWYFTRGSIYEVRRR